MEHRGIVHSQSDSRQNHKHVQRPDKGITDGASGRANVKTDNNDTDSIAAMTLQSGHPGAKVYYGDTRVFEMCVPETSQVCFSLIPNAAVVGQWISLSGACAIREH
jgi:hypothetical protein